MEILLFLSGLMFGGLISWGITHSYYKKASKDQNALYNKLSEEVRDAILNDNREKLSVLDLNELIREKTIDEEAGETIPYMACPRCGSQNLERTSDAEDGVGYDIIRCKECDWTKTSHGYESPRDDI